MISLFILLGALVMTTETMPAAAGEPQALESPAVAVEAPAVAESPADVAAEAPAEPQAVEPAEEPVPGVPLDHPAAPDKLAARMAKWGHPVKWRAAPDDQAPIVGAIAWPERSATNRRGPDDHGRDEVEVTDLGEHCDLALQADSAEAAETAAGFHAVYAGRWCFAGDAMRVGTIFDGLRELGIPARLVSLPRR